MKLGLHHRIMSGAGLELFSAATLPVASDKMARLLGAQALSSKLPLSAADIPLQLVPMARLGDDAQKASCAVELWLSDSLCRHGRAADILFRCDGQVMYGTLEIRTRDLSPDSTAAGASPWLRQASELAYRRIFSLLDAQGYPHLWRVWNYLAEINAESEGLERYRQFNVGRHQAFEAHDRLHPHALPAACALGMRGTDVVLSIAFLAARQPPLSIENPRQLAAYDYPADYGPRSPTFARATLAHLPGQAILFISGTASIIGHASVHAGDVLGQARETLANIQTLLDETTRLDPLADRPWRLRDLRYRAYLRRASDYLAVKAAVTAILGPDALVEYVEADICRAELLVEIEAVGVRSTCDVQTD